VVVVVVVVRCGLDSMDVEWMPLGRWRGIRGSILRKDDISYFGIMPCLMLDYLALVSIILPF